MQPHKVQQTNKLLFQIDIDTSHTDEHYAKDLFFSKALWKKHLHKKQPNIIKETIIPIIKMLNHNQSETPFGWLVVVPVVVTAGLRVVCDAPLGGRVVVAAEVVGGWVVVAAEVVVGWV